MSMVRMDDEPTRTRSEASCASGLHSRFEALRLSRCYDQEVVHGLKVGHMVMEVKKAEMGVEAGFHRG